MPAIEEKPTLILSKEHQNILKVVNALLAESSALEKGKQLDKGFFLQAVDFIRNYADKFHHAKEEDILFKEMCKPGVEMHCNPTDQMRYEHDLGRGFVKEMESGLNEGSKKKVAENARNYAQLLQEHIYKEDNILYPLADSALNARAQKTMLQAFAKAEKERFAKGTKEKYLKFAKEFEKRAEKKGLRVE